jgi:hypothetical protein
MCGVARYCLYRGVERLLLCFYLLIYVFDTVCFLCVYIYMYYIKNRGLLL